MDKYEYMSRIDCIRRCYINGDLSTQICKMSISSVIMDVWNNPRFNMSDSLEIIAHTDTLFKEIAQKIKQEEKE